MLKIIKLDQGIHFSVKTFRPLLIFPWHTAIYRVMPLENCLITFKHPDRYAAIQCHNDLIDLIEASSFKGDMPKLMTEFTKYGDGETPKNVTNYQVHEDGDLNIEIEHIYKDEVLRGPR